MGFENRQNYEYDNVYVTDWVLKENGERAAGESYSMSMESSGDAGIGVYGFWTEASCHVNWIFAQIPLV